MQIETMSTEELIKLRESIDAELEERDESWYGEVMENPIAYQERVMNPTPYEGDDDYIDHLHDCVRNDPDYFERPEPRCG